MLNIVCGILTGQLCQGRQLTAREHAIESGTRQSWVQELTRHDEKIIHT